MNKQILSLLALSIIGLSSTAYADFRVHIPLEKSSISFVSKSSGGENGNGSGGTGGSEIGGNDSGSGETPKPEEPVEEVKKTSAESCNEAIGYLNTYTASLRKTVGVSLSPKQTIDGSKGCPLNFAIKKSEFATYQDAKSFTLSVANYANTLKVFDSDHSDYRVLPYSGINISDVDSTFYLYWIGGSSFANESAIQYYWK